MPDFQIDKKSDDEVDVDSKVVTLTNNKVLRKTSPTEGWALEEERKSGTS